MYEHSLRLSYIARTFLIKVLGPCPLTTASFAVSHRSNHHEQKEKSEKAQAQILRDAFEGMKGRQPKSDQELNEWLATDEGKEATIFEATALSTWGDKARS